MEEMFNERSESENELNCEQNHYDFNMSVLILP